MSARAIDVDEETGPKVLSQASLDLKILAGFSVAFLAFWTFHLWPEWASNPDLSHGFLAPVLFLVLVHEARAAARSSYLRPSPFVSLTFILSSIGAVGLLMLAGLYAATLDWSHAVVHFLLAGSLCSFLSAFWIRASLHSARIIPFNWPAAAAILIWALTTPIPPGTYTQLTQTLQSSVAHGVITTLHFFGITAVRNGNVIELPHVSVGVEEACSGIRSLISCVFVSVFISTVMVQTAWRRFVILLLAPLLAITMNFLRSLALTLMAESGIDIAGRWHDLTGFAVLFVTAALLAAAAWLLSHTITRRPGHSRPSTPVDPATAPGWLRSGMLVTAGICITLLTAFALLTRSAPRLNDRPPDLMAIIPASATGWTVHTRDDLYQFSAQLHTDRLVERTYERFDEKGSPIQLTVYLAYWPPGQATVSLVASHTPDACWPGSGWVENKEAYRRVNLPTGAGNLLSAEYRSFELSGYPQHVWYWHLYAGHPVLHDGIGSPTKLLSLAWNYGFRKNGDQVFVRLSSNREWTELQNEPLVTELATRLQQIGLRPVGKNSAKSF